MKTQPARKAFEAIFGIPSDAYLSGGAIANSLLRRRATIEASDASSLDLSQADEWRVLVTLDGTPCNYLWLPGPGSVEDSAIAEAAVARHADSVFYYNQLVEELRRRLGAPQPSYARPSCSVVVCTHRRPHQLAHCLAALAKLEPPPDEVIVVDNDPGDFDCRTQVERAGALYLREDRRGLDFARNAGLRRANTDLVAFTDDDCVPSPGWLRSLPELFADPLVAAVTGPGFAYTLDTLAQERFERTGGFTRGLRRQTWDWTTLHPAASTRTGAGANMIFRRAILERLGNIFPPELDAGTPTQTGGDMYALYKTLACGYRVVYDPGTYVYHQHRPDWRALHRAFWGYGVGLSSTLAKLFVEDKEITAPLVWRWLWAQQRRALRGYIAGHLDRLDVAIGWAYLSGGLVGPIAWRRAKRAVDTSGGVRWSAPSADSMDANEPTPEAGNRGDEVAISIIIPTRDRPEMLRRCLNALAAQVGCPRFEVIVVDDGQSSEGRVAVEMPDGLSIRVLDTGGRMGPAGSRNLGARHARGELLLFLDDDLIVEADLLARHHGRHNEEPADTRVVVGYSAPRPTRDTFLTQRVAGWWEDHYRAKSQALSMTFTHMLSGNMSISSCAFKDLGGFDTAFGQLRREDWEFGIRALQSGVELCYEPRAVARHEFTVETRALFDMAFLEGKGDALLRRLHPSVAPVIRRPGLMLRLRHPLSVLGVVVLGAPAVRWLVASTLDLLQLARARKQWLRLSRIAWRAAYLRGLTTGGYHRTGSNQPPKAMRIELMSRAPIDSPHVVAPMIDVTLKGRTVARFSPRGGYWDGSIAEQIADALPDQWWAELSLEPPSGVRLAETAPVDFTGIRVIHTPGSDGRYAADSSRLPSAGATVVALGLPNANRQGYDDAYWRAVDDAIRTAPTELIAVALPGVRPSPEWLNAVKPCLGGDRVAAVLGAGMASRLPDPLVLVSRPQLRSPFPLIGRVPQYLAVRRSLYLALGGFDFSAAALGDYAVLIDYVERALGAGYVVGHRDTAGLKPVIGRRMQRRQQHERRKARAALLASHARILGGSMGAAWWLRYGLGPAAYQFWAGMRRRGLGPFGTLRSTWAFAAGTVVGFKASIRRRAEGSNDRALIADATMRTGTC